MPAVPVEVNATIDPEGREAVLLQLPDGYLVMKPESARDLAKLLVETAEFVESRL